MNVPKQQMLKTLQSWINKSDVISVCYRKIDHVYWDILILDNDLYRVLVRLLEKVAQT